jgi:hypothetical protein
LSEGAPTLTKTSDRTEQPPEDDVRTGVYAANVTPFRDDADHTRDVDETVVVLEALVADDLGIDLVPSEVRA